MFRVSALAAGCVNCKKNLAKSEKKWTRKWSNICWNKSPVWFSSSLGNKWVEVVGGAAKISAQVFCFKRMQMEVECHKLGFKESRHIWYWGAQYSLRNKLLYCLNIYPLLVLGQTSDTSTSHFLESFIKGKIFQSKCKSWKLPLLRRIVYLQLESTVGNCCLVIRALLYMHIHLSIFN